MTLVTLVQPNKTVLIPIIFNFKEWIKKHILIYDSEHASYARELEEGIGKLSERYGLVPAVVETLVIDEDSRRDLSKIQERLALEEGEELYLNGAEADLAVFTILSGSLLARGGTVLAYDKEDNSYNAITQKGFENFPITQNMKIEDFLILMGEELIGETSKWEILERREALTTIFQDAKRMFRVRRLLQQRKFRELKTKYPGIFKSLKELEMVSDHKSLDRDSSLSSFGFFFEQFVFLSMERFDFDDIKCGAKIVFDRQKKETLPDTIVTNEFDILTIKKNRIGFIECKIGDNFQPLATVYKGDALMDYFGDDSRSLIVNIQPDATPHLAKSRLSFSEQLKFRANTKRIDIFNAFDLGKNKFAKVVSESFGVLPRHFLLGGYDLEMLSIKELLEKTGQRFTDRKPGWGAKLSDYADILNDEEHFYAIELDVDIEPPRHFTLIDHHNELQDRPASIEQILQLLDYPTDRFYTLVALNDKGYIPAMLAFGASEKEIERIRRLDRRAQGVSQEDEKLAEESIARSRTVGRVVEVESLTKRFSPIVDRLYGKNVLIHTETKLGYYGEGVREIVEAFKGLIEEKRAYYGGGYGFFGIVEGGVDREGIKKISSKILEIVNRD